MNSIDLDETARGILMDIRANRAYYPLRSLYLRLHEEGYPVSVLDTVTLYTKYMVFDGAQPTHDLDTGARK